MSWVTVIEPSTKSEVLVQSDSIFTELWETKAEPKPEPQKRTPAAKK